MITDDTLDALRDNDERLDNLFFYLDDFSLDDNDDELTLAIRGNTRVTAVDVDMHVDVMTDTIGTLMHEIGMLGNLQRLRCSSSGDYAVTMAAMAKAMTASHRVDSHLTSLDLANFLLQDPSDTAKEDDEEESLARVSYKDFITGLRGHPTLKNFNLGFGYSSHLGGSSNSHTTSCSCHQEQELDTLAHCSLTPLVESLMTIPRLDWVRMDGAGSAPRSALTPPGLSALCSSSSSSSSSVTTLEVHDFDWSLCHIQSMAEALATNTNLKVLSLSCHTLLHNHNHNNGKTIKESSKTQTTMTGAACMAQALRNNTSLETLLIPLELLLCGMATSSSARQNSNIDKNVKSMVDFFQALEANNSLKKLQINGRIATTNTNNGQETTVTSLLRAIMILDHPETLSAFRHMLQHNYGLESIQLSFDNNNNSNNNNDLPLPPPPLSLSSPECQAEIALHTRLNAMGRGRLVRDTDMTRSQWIDSFCQVQDDLSCLFHLLLLNPLLCSTTNNSSGTTGTVASAACP